MAGFISGFAQGIAGLPEALDRRDALKVRQQAEARQFQLEQQKVMGEDIKSLGEALQPGITPEEQVGDRVNLFIAKAEQNTGPWPAAVKQLAKKDPYAFAKSLSALFAEQPFDQKTFGQIMMNPSAVAGIMDGLNRRQAAMKASANVASGLGAPQAPSGISVGVNPGVAPPAPSPVAGQPGFDLSAIDAGINKAINAIGQIDHTDPLAKEHIAALQAQASELREQRKFALTNMQTLAATRHGWDLAKATPSQLQIINQEVNAQTVSQAGATEGAQTAARRRATNIPLDVAQTNQLPINTTYGQLDEGGGGAGGVTPQQLDNLRQTESGGDQFAVNKQTGAMGPYQFMPATVADMHRKGIVFNPFIESEARAAAGGYINKLLQQNGGDMRKALAAYGGFVTKNPDDYIAKVMKGSIAGQAQGGGGGSLVPPSRAFQTQETFQAEDAAKQFSAYQKVGEKAAEDKAQMQQLDSMLKKAGETGAAANTKLAAQRFAKGWLGLDIPASANYAEASKALALKLALKLRDPSEGGGLPGSMSNYEDMLLQTGINNIDKLEGTNTILANAYINNKQRTIEITKLMRDYAKEQKAQRLPIDVGDLTAIAQDYKEKHPIFSADDAKKLLSQPASSNVKAAPAVELPASWDAEKRKRFEEYKRGAK